VACGIKGQGESSARGTVAHPIPKPKPSARPARAGFIKTEKRTPNAQRPAGAQLAGEDASATPRHVLQRQDSQITAPPSERRAQGRARHKALRALEANQSLNYLWRPPLGARAPKTEFLRLNQRKHTTHALQRTTGTTPSSVTHWEFTGGVWEVACSSGVLGEAGMGPGHRQNGGQRQERHLDATEGHSSTYRATCDHISLALG
jgi:hypothetical protein